MPASAARFLCRLLAACLATGLAGPFAAAQTLPDEVSSLPWVVDGGYVESHTRAGAHVYVGGSFRSIARPSSVIGPFGAFDATTAELLAAEPALKGQQVHAVASDGAGGWFLGGRFVIGARTLAVVRLDPAGRQTAWAVEFDGQVEALARAGGTLYLAGQFNTVGGQPRQNVAAVDVATGAVLPWNPGVVGVGVYALKVSGADAFLGGQFSSVGGTPRANLARVDAVSGALQPWAPAVSGGHDVVRAIEANASTVFVGGGFTSVGGASRLSFAALDRATGAVLGAAPDPGGGPYGLVSALALVGNTVYIGGIFERIAGIARYNAAAVDATTGLLLSWAPVNDVEGAVRAIQPVSGGVVIGGDLGLPGRRRHVAKVDAVSGTVLPSWDAAAGAEVLGLAVDGTRVGVAGYFTTYRAIPARGLAGFDVATGAAITLPGVFGAVRALAASSTTLYVGGYIYAIGGVPLSHLGAIDLATRAVLPFAPFNLFGQPVNSLLFAGGMLYATGDFTSVNGVPRDRLAAFDPDTGALLAFQAPSFGGTSTAPYVMAAAGGRVWVGGAFTSVGGQARSGLAALNATTGALDALDLSPDGPVTMAVDGTVLYLNGAFQTLAGQARRGLARVDAQTGVLDAWTPPFLLGLGGIAANGGVVIAHATASPVGLRQPFVSIDPVTAMYDLTWGASIETGSSGLSLYPDGLFLTGGDTAAAPRFLARRTGGSLEAVRDFGVHLQGDVLTMRWTPSLTGALPTSYRLAVGSGPGLNDVASLLLGPASQFTAAVPPGRYYVRLFPRAGGAEGPPTPEFAIASGPGGCVAPPGAPTLSVTGAGAPVLSWSAAPGAAPSAYELRAGPAPGVHGFITVPTTATSLSTAGAPAGTYYAVVAGVNACGVSVASNEVQVIVAAPGAPAAPTALAASVTGTTVSLSWTPPAGAITGYVLEAGSAPGLANLVAGLTLGSTPSFTRANVPSGTYFVRVRAANGALASAPSNEVVVTVP